MSAIVDENGIVWNIRLHDETGVLFHCDCGGVVFRQVTDILQGSLGYETFECKDCKSWYVCNTVAVMHVE